MKQSVYDQAGNLLENYDLTLGRITEGSRLVKVSEQPMVEEKWHYETLQEYAGGGRDVRRVVDVPGKPYIPAHEERVDCLVYIPYTENELEQMRKPTQEMRIAALEEENANLREALELLLSGEVE